jgi:hypothetical protein
MQTTMSAACLVAPRSFQCHQPAHQKQMVASMRPQKLRRTLRPCAAEGQNGTSETASPRISSPSQQLVIKVGAAGACNPGVGVGHGPGFCPPTAATA